MALGETVALAELTLWAAKLKAAAAALVEQAEASSVALNLAVTKNAEAAVDPAVGKAGAAVADLAAPSIHVPGKAAAEWVEASLQRRSVVDCFAEG